MAGARSIRIPASLCFPRTLQASTISYCALQAGYLVCATALIVSACGSPTAPSGSSTRSQSVLVKISGVTVLTPGLSTQLTATVTAPTGTAVPSDVLWHTQDPNVATVSSAGLVTGIYVGSTVITATTSGVTGQVSVIVQATGTGTTTVTACGLISAPGNYVLDHDLQGNGSRLNLSNVANVHLDCRGHTLSGVRLSGVNDGTVNNCIILDTLVVTNGASVTISDVALEGQLSIMNGWSVQVSDSRIKGSGNTVTLVTAATGTILLRDTISNTGNGGASAVDFLNGTSNQVMESTISGAYDGGHGNVGTDDGIILENETGDTVRDNLINGFFDIGIESVDALTNTTIAGNTFTNIGVGGVGSIYCTDWSNNVIRANQTSSVPTLIFVGYQLDTAHCGTPTPPASLVNNQFVGNVFRNPIDGTLHRSGSAGPSMSVASGIATVSGNLLQDNDFASYNGPDLNPISGFIDGGGNICAPPVPGISNFVCTGQSGFTSDCFAVLGPYGGMAAMRVDRSP